jgi:hypothetical protein
MKSPTSARGDAQCRAITILGVGPGSNPVANLVLQTEGVHGVRHPRSGPISHFCEVDKSPEGVF